MPEVIRFYDLFLVYHPDDVTVVRRIAAQLNAMGTECRFEEDDFRKSAVDVGELKANVLRSHTIGVVLSPVSAASQLCNELIQYAVNNSKRIVSLILDEDIEVEVHPAIAENPFVYFRQQDKLAERVDELRQHLTVDHETRLHTELLVAADKWQRRGRRPSQLLPPQRVAEARQWLAGGSGRNLKPSPLLVEFIHSSRRQRQPSQRKFPRARIGIAAIVLIGLGLGFLLLRAALRENQAAQAAAASTSAAQTQMAMTAVAGTAASDSVLILVDRLAATSVMIGESVSQTAQAVAVAATQTAEAEQTANAIATVARATDIYERARDADAARLVDAAKAALDAGDSELALALAWVAKDALDDPKSAYRVLRPATAAGRSASLADVSALRFQPGGDRFAVITFNSDKALIYDSATWEVLAEISDHTSTISQLAYSPDGSTLITASDDGEIVVRDGKNGSVIKRWTGRQGAVAAMAFHPSGDRIFSAGSESSLAAWDIETGEQLAGYAPTDGQAGVISDLLVSADGGRVIGWLSDAGTMVMAQWAAEALEPLDQVLDGLVYRGYDADYRYGYSGGRSLPAYPGDTNTGDLIIWDLAAGEQIVQLTEGFNWSLGDLTVATDELLYISFDDDVALVGVESSDGGQRDVLVSLVDGAVIQQFEDEHAAGWRSADFLDSQTLVALTRDNRVLLWSSEDGSVIREIGRAPQDLSAIDFNAEANTVIGMTDDGRVYLWRLSEGRGESVETMPDVLPGSSISPSGELLILVNESGLSLQDVASGDIKRTIDGRQVSYEGAFFAVYDDERVIVYDAESGEEAQSWTVGWDDLREMHLAQDGERLLALVGDDELWLLRSGSDEPLKLDAGNAGTPSKVEFAATGERMLSLHQDRALLWDVNSGRALGGYPLDLESGAAVDAAFDSAGETLYFFVRLENDLASLTAVALADNSVRRSTYIDVADGKLSRDGQALLLWLREGGISINDTMTGEALHSLPLAAGSASQSRYLAEPGLLITAVGAELALWDVEDGEVNQRFEQAQPIAEFSVSDDGQRILTRDAAGVHRLWQVESPAELLRRIEAESPPRDLTCDERVQHFVLPLCE